MTNQHPFNKNYNVGSSQLSGPKKLIPGGTASAPSGGFSGGDWATVISGIAQGAANASGGGSTGAGRKGAKEQKKRTLANLLNQALNHKHSHEKADTENKNRSKEFKSDALQSTARGFVNAFKKK